MDHVHIIICSLFPFVAARQLMKLLCSAFEESGIL